MNSSSFEGHRAIRYLGQYKPIAPYPLTEGLLIVPAGWGMFTWGYGEMRLNVSYLVGPDELSDQALADIYRKWLAFDAFILHDSIPITYFDNNTIGAIDVIPADVSPLSQNPDYNQIDYENIAHIALTEKPSEENLPSISYATLFASYIQLADELKEMIEWYVSLPFRWFIRPNSFFNTNYWQLIHAVILLERLIGQPPRCLDSVGVCATCNTHPQRHYSMTRRDWLRKFLADRINSVEVRDDYARTIDTAISVRNKIAHTPLFDRSESPEFPIGETQTYGIDRATTDYEHDFIALQSLLFSLREISRYLLLDQAFGTKYYPKLKSLNAVRIASGETSSLEQ